MKAVIRVAALTLLMFPVMVAAQEPQPLHPLAGFWEGSIQEPGAQEPTTVLVELRIQGDVVNGPVLANGSEQYILQGGIVTPNSVEFTIPRLHLADRNVPLRWTGQLTGSNELAFSVVPQDNATPALEFALIKRQTP